MLNIQNLVLPEASSSNQALVISAQKKRRRHVIESSDEDYKKIFRVSFVQLFSFSLQLHLLYYPFKRKANSDDSLPK